METLTVRISRSAYASLQALSAEVGEPMTEVLGKAIEEYRKKHDLRNMTLPPANRNVRGRGGPAFSSPRPSLSPIGEAHQALKQESLDKLG